MKTVIATLAALTLLGACAAPAPICDREAQEWTKFGTQEDVCAPVTKLVAAQPIDWPHDDDDKDRTERPTDVRLPTPPEAPTSPPVTPPSEPVTPPSVPETPSEPDRPKGDNSDANGKGGNKHNRDDFTHGGTEVAEDKKNK